MFSIEGKDFSKLFDKCRKNDQWLFILGTSSNSDGCASDAQIRRCSKAIELYQNNSNLLLIPMGAAVANEHIEAQTMSIWLAENGVNQDKIVAENHTTTTREQIKLIEILDNKFTPEAITIVSDSPHIPRIRMLLAKTSIASGKFTTVGADFPALHELYRQILHEIKFLVIEFFLPLK